VKYIVEILVDIPSILRGNLSLYGYQVFKWWGGYNLLTQYTMGGILSLKQKL